MVEVGVREGGRELQRVMEGKLERIVKDFSFEEGGKTIFRGHPAIYTDTVVKTFELVQRSGGLKHEQLLARKPHWHED